MKQHVVHAILRDFFRIMSHGIYFSSHAILKTSDGILVPTDKIRENSEENQENRFDFYRAMERFLEKHLHNAQ